MEEKNKGHEIEIVDTGDKLIPVYYEGVENWKEPWAGQKKVPKTAKMSPISKVFLDAYIEYGLDMEKAAEEVGFSLITAKKALHRRGALGYILWKKEQKSKADMLTPDFCKGLLMDLLTNPDVPPEKKATLMALAYKHLERDNPKSEKEKLHTKGKTDIEVITGKSEHGVIPE